MTFLSPLAEAFEAVLRDRRSDVLVMAPSESLTLTAQDIDDQARDLSAALAALPVARGHLVVAEIGNVSVMPALVLACLRNGVALMPVDRSTPPAELLGLASRWDAAALVVPDGLHLGLVAEGSASPRPARHRVPFARGLAAWVTTPLPDPGRHAPAALLRLTSGSTAEPRVTCTEERHLIADVVHITDAMGIGPTTRQFGVIPLSHSYGFSNLLLPLLWQGTPVLLRPQFVPTQVAPDIRSAALETFAGVPFMFDHLARHQPMSGTGSLRLAVSAGALLAYDTVTAFHRETGVKVRSFYGTSETGGICFDGSDTLDERVPVGRPIGATHVSLVADTEAPDGSGSVCVSGPNVLDRYADDGPPSPGPRRTTAARLDGVYLTSDYARLDPDGMYVLTGRVPSFVNVAGRKVHPHEVEAALRALPGVSDAVAMGVDDVVRGQALGACLVSDAAWDALTVRAALSTQLAAYKLPRVVVVTQALPLTDRGKVDRAAIARLLGQS
jgi:acyl-CoA synthetase (AMP-forming)/AMP-acid ligase II